MHVSYDDKSISSYGQSFDYYSRTSCNPYLKLARVIEQKPETDVEPEPETTKRPNRSSNVNKEVKGGWAES